MWAAGYPDHGFPPSDSWLTPASSPTLNLASLDGRYALKLFGFTIVHTQTYALQGIADWLAANDEGRKQGYERGYAAGWKHANDLICAQPDGPELHMTVGKDIQEKMGAPRV